MDSQWLVMNKKVIQECSILAARIHSERSTRRVRISTWGIFQLTGSSRVGFCLDETSEWRYKSTIDQLNDKSPLTTFVNEGNNAISWLEMKFFHGEMRSKSAMEGESSNPADFCWHQLQSQKISHVQLYGTGYRVSFSNTDFGKFEKYQFFMKQGNWDNNSNIEQLNLKSPMVTFVNEVMNDVPWQMMKNCCWEMKEKSNMTNASNWMMSTLWGTKCCVEQQDTRVIANVRLVKWCFSNYEKYFR